ncbi:hypothetical protein Y1Q_0019225 [Alligator mississippiensis]|uniref:Uncharacterized protein n=1 Tax=Alligator mississippiensis TaxID=8496 RepID=A0A151MQH7_ALLMI|nr:hypothetical protein Y1Q_0019225 [Alligator mississippiensis]
MSSTTQPGNLLKTLRLNMSLTNCQVHAQADNHEQSRITSTFHLNGGRTASDQLASPGRHHRSRGHIPNKMLLMLASGSADHPCSTGDEWSRCPGSFGPVLGLNVSLIADHP